MIFGDPRTFAIEAGSTELEAFSNWILVQFRFWISGIAFGDWEDRIQLATSIEYASRYCDLEGIRCIAHFPNDMDASDVFRIVYDAFFQYDYLSTPALDPTLQELFHIGDIGLGSIADKVAVVAVTMPSAEERIIVKDLRRDEYVADAVVRYDLVETVLRSYVKWGSGSLSGYECS